MRILALKTVLAATDLRDDSLPTLRAAHTIAQAAGATLHVVHVGPVDFVGGEATHAQLGQIGVRLDQATVHTVPGEAADGIVTLAHELCADVVVMGPHDRTRVDDGGPAAGTALRVATAATVPCLLVNEQAHIPVDCVVVAHDGSDTARGAMKVALSWTSALRGSRVAGSRETTLLAVHVDATSRTEAERAEVRALAEERIAILRADAGTWAGVRIDYDIIRATDVCKTIVAFARSRKADLIVMGTRGVGLDDAPRLGSTSTAVSAKLRIPLLLIPPAVWRRLALEPEQAAEVDDCAAHTAR